MYEYESMDDSSVKKALADIDAVLGYQPKQSGFGAVTELASLYKACIDRWAPPGSSYAATANNVDLFPTKNISRPATHLSGILKSLREDIAANRVNVMDDQVRELNQRARRLLALIHRRYLKYGGAPIRCAPNDETLKAADLNADTYLPAARRLVDKGLAKWSGNGGVLTNTPEGINAAENPDLLERMLPIAARAFSSPIRNRAPMSNKVFVVHGHDDHAKTAVENFLHRLKVEPIILHLQPNGGRTIIEKLEDEAAPAAYAVILLTPDDEGRKKGDPALRDRARQNVIFEWGLFVGTLKRKNVCALHKGIELPSDMQGVLYVEMDGAGVWQRKLATELRAAGLTIDIDAALAC